MCWVDWGRCPRLISGVAPRQDAAKFLRSREREKVPAGRMRVVGFKTNVVGYDGGRLDAATAQFAAKRRKRRMDISPTFSLLVFVSTRLSPSPCTVDRCHG